MNATVSFYNDAKAESSCAKPSVSSSSRPARCKTIIVFVVFNGHAVKRAVTTGGNTAKGVRVESGLIGGEDLIVNPPADLKDGQKVITK